MQKIALVLSFIALALGIYAVASNGASSPEASDANTRSANNNQVEATAPDTDGLSVAYIRGDSLNLRYQFILDKQDELITTTRQSENKLQREMSKAEREYGELVQYIQSGQAKEDEMQIAQQRMMELEYELQDLQQKEQQRIMQKEQAFQREMNDRLNAFLKKYARENNIDLILNWGVSGEGVLYGSDPYDITRDVIQSLNAEYALEQANANTAE